jgi:hypothetical protein
MFDQALLTKLLCVAFVAAVMLPAGASYSPYVSQDLSGMQFHPQRGR